jgi:hypothetical protein
MTRSRSLVAVLLALAACGDDGSMLPINPGGGGPGGSTNPDAAVQDDGGANIAGRVCVLVDARALSSCASSGAGGLTVQLGTQMATTIDDGSFVITRPSGTDLVWRVSGDGIEPSALPLASASTIPAIDSLLYDDMLAITNATLGSGGALIARVGRSGTPSAGVVATASPQPSSEVYYDGASTLEWETDATGSSGIVWIPSIATGTASLSFDNGVNQTSLVDISIFSDTITFAYGTAPAP